jgi:hypothetical protein
VIVVPRESKKEAFCFKVAHPSKKVSNSDVVVDDDMIAVAGASRRAHQRRRNDTRCREVSGSRLVVGMCPLSSLQHRTYTRTRAHKVT